MKKKIKKNFEISRFLIFEIFLYSLNNDGSFEKSPHVMNAHDQQVPSNEICISLDEAEHTNDGSTSSAKRLKISDINISRYEQEFVEIKEIASGTFGTVKVARHRLDGMVYAIKVIRQLFYIKKIVKLCLHLKATLHFFAIKKLRNDKKINPELCIDEF